jgi:hypothetical protein
MSKYRYIFTQFCSRQGVVGYGGGGKSLQIKGQYLDTWYLSFFIFGNIHKLREGASNKHTNAAESLRREIERRFFLLTVDN